MTDPITPCTRWEVPAELELSPAAQAWREARYIAMHIWYAIRGPLVPPAPALKEGDKRPVVIVPGFLGRSEIYVPLQRRINEAGHPCYILPLGFQMGDVLKKGRELTDLLNRHQLDDVYVVGHSMGGLISVGSILQGEQRIRHLWCLGSPLFGTTIVQSAYALAALILLLCIPLGYGPWMIVAGVYLIPAMRQMSRESVLLRWFRRHYDGLENVTSIFARFDEIVHSSPRHEPGSTSRFGRPSDVYFPEIGHNNLFMGEAGKRALVNAITSRHATDGRIDVKKFLLSGGQAREAAPAR